MKSDNGVNRKPGLKTIIDVPVDTAECPRFAAGAPLAEIGSHVSSPESYCAPLSVEAGFIFVIVEFVAPVVSMTDTATTPPHTIMRVPTVTAV